MKLPPEFDLSSESSGSSSEALASESVTLVITSYNHGHFLPAAIESGLAQTRPFHEIIVVDDGSNDDTGAVVARYPTVRYARQENQGLPAARNCGLRLACASHIVFLDADDRLHPIAVEAGLNCCRANPAAAFVYGRFRYIQPSGAADPPKPLRHWGAAAYCGFLRRNFVEMHATVMYRRDVVVALRGFDEQLRAGEDYDLYLRAARDHQVACHDAVVADYHLHDSNMSHDGRLMLLTSLRVLGRQRDYAKRNSAQYKAYKEGLRNWQECYGPRFASQIIRRHRSGVPWSALAGDLFLLLTRAPYALLAKRSTVLQWALQQCVGYLPFRIRSWLMARWSWLS
jgi:glycosyltransferase involved in cell wall biosynthesis